MVEAVWYLERITSLGTQPNTSWKIAVFVCQKTRIVNSMVKGRTERKVTGRNAKQTHYLTNSNATIWIKNSAYFLLCWSEKSSERSFDRYSISFGRSLMNTSYGTKFKRIPGLCLLEIILWGKIPNYCKFWFSQFKQKQECQWHKTNVKPIPTWEFH